VTSVEHLLAIKILVVPIEYMVLVYGEERKDAGHALLGLWHTFVATAVAVAPQINTFAAHAPLHISLNARSRIMNRKIVIQCHVSYKSATQISKG
jgi:hypothetical protein